MDDRREARAEGGRRFQREGAITAKDYLFMRGVSNVVFIFFGLLFTQRFVVS